MEDRHVNLLLTRLLHDMPLKEQQSFDHALHIVSTWKQAIPITGEYLRSLNTSITKIVAQYSAKQRIGKIYCVKECWYPALSWLGVGVVMLLLKKYIPALCIVNGSIGITKNVYKSKEIPQIETLFLHIKWLTFHLPTFQVIKMFHVITTKPFSL